MWRGTPASGYLPEAVKERRVTGCWNVDKRERKAQVFCPYLATPSNRPGSDLTNGRDRACFIATMSSMRQKDDTLPAHDRGAVLLEAKNQQDDLIVGSGKPALGGICLRRKKNVGVRMLNWGGQVTSGHVS